MENIQIKTNQTPSREPFVEGNGIHTFHELIRAQ